MIIFDERLNTLSHELWEWTKKGKPVSEAPDDIKAKIQEYRELSQKLKNEELRMWGLKV